MASSMEPILFQNVIPIILEPVGRDDVLGLLEGHRAVADRRVQGVLSLVFGLGTYE